MHSLDHQALVNAGRSQCPLILLVLIIQKAGFVVLICVFPLAFFFNSSRHTISKRHYESVGARSAMGLRAELYYGK